MRSGQRVRARLFDVKRLDSSLGHIRVAILVPKYGFDAIRRNKLKRRLRELVRQRVLLQSVSCDLLVRARREAYDAPFDLLRDEIEQLAAQLP